MLRPSSVSDRALCAGVAQLIIAEAVACTPNRRSSQRFASLFPTYWETIDLKAPRGEEGDYPDPIRTQPNFPERREHCDQRIYSAQIDAFVKAAASRQGRTEQHYRPAWEPGIVVMRIVDAAYRSEKTGKVIHLTPAEDEPG